MALVHELEAILQAPIWPPTASVPDLVRRLPAHLGSPDPRLRETVYGVLARAVEQDHLDTAALTGLLETVLDREHLFFGIGSEGDDTVFTRTFSVLIVGEVADADVRRPRLDPAMLEGALRAVLDYASRERDWRGYVEEKGWAHAGAHIADALGALGCHPAIPPVRRIDILRAIGHIGRVHRPLAFMEDDRLALSAHRITLSEGLPPGEIRSWIDGFHLPEDLSTPDAVVEVANAEHFLRSLFFRYRRTGAPFEDLDWFTDVLDRFDITRLTGDP